MHFFITGATGYIGRVVVEHAIVQGHTVHGLSRTEQGDELLKGLGATPVRGDLTTLDVLSRESASADAVLQLAYIHDWGMDFDELLRIDGAAVDALAGPLKGSNKPLIITSGTGFVLPDASGEETDENAPVDTSFVLARRIESEQRALRWAEKGVRVIAIRLPPYVYGRGGSHFLPALMQTAAKLNESLYVEPGTICTCDVHVDDTAELYLLVAQAKLPPNTAHVFNGTAHTTVTIRQLAEAVGAALHVPVRSVTRTELKEKWGVFLAGFVNHENRAGSRKAVEQLGWKPKQVDMLTDAVTGSYKDLAAKLTAN